MRQNLSFPIRSSEITPERLYLSRRDFIKGAVLLGGGVILAACAPGEGAQPAPTPVKDIIASKQSDELNDPLTTFEGVTGYNNYYEFTPTKEGVASLAKNFKTTPWQVQIGGLVQKPVTLGYEDILKLAPQEERIYRLRCVEAWSMVIPWNGFPLSQLLKQVEPLGSAKYVKFTTLSAPDEMPGMASMTYPWPYVEGLRIDEAMHPLTIMATGLYGKNLLPQNGAPLRLVIPWKYGFKSIKAIVKIEFVAEEPISFWSKIAPDEYGFYANVNPKVSHPRWSQATERRIGESSRRATLMFNGYGDQVASMYSDLDLKSNY